MRNFNINSKSFGFITNFQANNLELANIHFQEWLDYNSFSGMKEYFIEEVE